MITVMQARIQGNDELSFHLGLEQECVSFPLLLSIFRAASVDMIVHRFATNQAAVSDLVLLDDAQKRDDGERLKVETPLEEARSIVWAMLYVDDEGVGSRAPDGLARIIVALVVVREGGGKTVLERRIELMRFWSVPSSAETVLRSARQVQGKSRGPSMSTIAVLSARMRMFPSKSNATSALRELASNSVMSDSTIDPTPSDL